MPKAVYQLLLARQVVVPGDIKQRMDGFVRPNLLAIRAFTRTYDMNLIFVWKPHSNIIFAMPPL